MTDEMEVARLLGARQAFGMVAGRCSAADANILRAIRDGKKYIGICATWDDFCEKHLHLSKRHANRLIAQLNDLGPNYFTLAQLTSITPDEFRRFRDHVTDNGLEYGGEAIALIEQNTERLSSAVTALRQSPSLAPPSDLWKRKLQETELRLNKSLDQLETLRQDPNASEWAGNVLYTLRKRVSRLMEIWGVA